MIWKKKRGVHFAPELSEWVKKRAEVGGSSIAIVSSGKNSGALFFRLQVPLSACDLRLCHLFIVANTAACG